MDILLHVEIAVCVEPEYWARSQVKFSRNDQTLACKHPEHVLSELSCRRISSYIHVYIKVS